MAFRPNFDDTVQIAGTTMSVKGTSPEGAVPVHIHVLVEQGDTVAGGPVDVPAATWQVDLSADGFGPGPALACGVEIHARPLQTTTWTQAITIE